MTWHRRYAISVWTLRQVLNWRANGWRASCSPQGSHLKSCCGPVSSPSHDFQCSKQIPFQMKGTNGWQWLQVALNDLPRSGRRHHSIQATKKSEPGLFQCIVPQGLMCKLLDAEVAVTRIQQGGWVFWIVSQGIPGSQDLMYMFSLPLGSGWIRMDQVPGQETSRLTTCAEPRWPKVEASAVQWTQSPDAVNGPCPQTFVLHLWVGRRRPATQKWQRFFQGTLLDLDLMTGDISMTSLIISIYK